MPRWARRKTETDVPQRGRRVPLSDVEKIYVIVHRNKVSIRKIAKFFKCDAKTVRNIRDGVYHKELTSKIPVYKAIEERYSYPQS